VAWCALCVIRILLSLKALSSEPSTLLFCHPQDNQEEFEIDLNDDEPEFLKGHSSRSGIEMSPVKIVKNPEGSLQRAAMTQVSTASHACADGGVALGALA
jgi:hypothetical protein